MTRYKNIEKTKQANKTNQKKKIYRSPTRDRNILSIFRERGTHPMNRENKTKQQHIQSSLDSLPFLFAVMRDETRAL